jgi:hypothetical protein
VINGDAHECTSGSRSARAGRMRARPLAVLACGVVLMLSPPAASADTHVFSSDFGRTGAGAGQFATGNGAASPSGVAVNGSTGDLYVADPGNARIDQFDSTGAFIRAWGWGVADGFTEAPQTCTLTCFAGIPGYGTPGQLFGPTFVAVDNSGGPSQGDVYVADANNTISVSKFDSSGNPVAGWGTEGQLGGFEGVAGVAVNAAGDLWVLAQSGGLFEYDQNGSVLREAFISGGIRSAGIAVDTAGSLYVVAGTGAIEKLSDTGALIGTVTVATGATGIAVDQQTRDLYVDEGTSIQHFTAACDPSVGLCTPDDSFGSPQLADATGLAVSSAAGVVYAGDGAANQVDAFASAVLPRVVTGTAFGVQPTTAALRGRVNPEGVEITDCHFEYGATTSYGQTAQCIETVGSGTAGVQVHAEVAGLEPRTGYHFRLDAANANGAVHGGDQLFATIAPPAVDGESARTVSSTEALLRAQVNPGNADTTYHFEYGTTTGYGASVPVPDADLGSGDTDLQAGAQLTGLRPSTAYHYRIVASNTAATSYGPDQTFTTFAPVATTLPDGRAYELVTPVDKLGNPVPVAIGENGAAVSADGERVLYFSLGVFGDQGGGLNGAFEATRTPEGWRSTSVALPFAAEHPSNSYAPGSQPIAATPDLATLFYNPPTLTEANAAVASSVVARDPGGSFVSVSRNEVGGAEYRGSSGNASHVIFEMTPSEEQGDLAAGTNIGGVMSLYDGTAGSILPVGVDSGGAPVSSCGSVLAGTEESVFDYNYTNGVSNAALFGDAVSSDGSRVFFITPDANGHHFSGDPSCGKPSELYVREDDARTTEVSLSQRSGALGTPAAHGVHFEGASADGSRVFFHSVDQLLDDPAAASGGLYEYNLESHALKFIASGGLWGTSLEADGFAPQMSADGSHVYFLGSVPGVGPAGENLYLSNGGRISFIHVKDFLTHSSVVSADGSTLAFLTSSNLTSYDSYGQPEIYVFEAGGDGLRCISCTPDGSPPAGPAELYGAAGGGSARIASHNVSDDGGRIFFDSPDRLLPAATNGLYNVYEYESGTLHLLSDGRGPYASRLVGASRSGNDVIIATADSLVPQDRDNGIQDLYDVRVGGGFPTSSPFASCEADSCQAAPSVAPLAPSAASSTLVGSGNLPSAIQKPVPRSQPRPMTRTQKLAEALRACRAKPAHRRAECMSRARNRYAARSRHRRRDGRTR